MLFLQYVVKKRPLNEINCLKLNCHGNVSWKTWNRLLTTRQSHSQDHPRLHSENDLRSAAGSNYHQWTCQAAMHAYIRLIWPFWPKLKNNPFWLKCKDILNLQLVYKYNLISQNVQTTFVIYVMFTWKFLQICRYNITMHFSTRTLSAFWLRLSYHQSWIFF